MNTNISISILDSLVAGLDNIAQETQCTRSFHSHKAIEAYLEEYIDLQIAYDRLHDDSDKTISMEAMRQKLGL